MSAKYMTLLCYVVVPIFEQSDEFDIPTPVAIADKLKEVFERESCYVTGVDGRAFANVSILGITSERPFE
jgi:hypothetical protein